ncbi:MAG: hypothetical protein IKV57_11465 [Clostridia bacterium]|nr:hypothetical protein [Clostridia bacterium]
MGIAGTCRQCGENVQAGDFCYRLSGDYWCCGCIRRAAVIASEERIPPETAVRTYRRTGRFREREIGLQTRIHTGKKGAEGACRKSW